MHHLGPIWGLTFLELKELRVAQGGEERKGAGGGGEGAWVLVAGAGFAGLPAGHKFAAAMGACAGGVRRRVLYLRVGWGAWCLTPQHYRVYRTPRV